MTTVRESFTPHVMAADSSYNIKGLVIGGFLAKTSGTISIVGRNSQGTSAETFVDAVPVTAGAYTPLPMAFPSPDATVALGGGASGTLFV